MEKEIFMHKSKGTLLRAMSFAETYGLNAPIMLAPMAGACPTSLSISVAKGGGMGACGVLMMNPDQIFDWVNEMRAFSNGTFQLNTWIPDPDPVRNIVHEVKLRQFLAQWGPEVLDTAGNSSSPNFTSQCEAMLEANPKVISSIMGLYPSDYISRMKIKNIKWFATVTTVAEAIQAEQAGADVIVAQGMEAGGHRGSFIASTASENLVGLFSLLPAVINAVDVPVVATGGIADAKGVAAALVLGASAVQIGTGFLRSPEAKIPEVWADAIALTNPEDTIATRAFSGRLGRSIRNKYAVAASSKDAPEPAPYPIQRHLTQGMRKFAIESKKLDGMQTWAGQSAKLAPNVSASKTVISFWENAKAILE